MNLIPWRNRTGTDLERLGTASQFRREMERVFNRLFTEPFAPETAFEKEFAWGPDIDLAETDDAVTLKAELPGIDPKEVDIAVTGNTLTLRGEKKQEREEKKRNYHYIERHYGSFYRSVPLPCAVVQDKVDAAYKDGVLTITLPKDPQHKPRKIAVHGG